uniref:ABC transporter domain-containing protein n=2 Tax=Macrostomum lignano TaxID=282301 RepID=A0A1I8GVX9_9PLAT
SEFAAETAAYLANEIDAIQADLDSRYSVYARKLRNLRNNAWLAFPRSLFNRSGAGSSVFVESLYNFQQAAPSGLSEWPARLQRNDVDFMTFLEDTTAGELHLIPTRLWRRYDRLLPDFRNLPELELSSRDGVNVGVSVSEEQRGADSHRYFSNNDDSLLLGLGSRSTPDDSAGDSSASTSESNRAAADAPSGVQLVQLRLLLLLLDLLLLAHRVCGTVAAVRSLLRRQAAATRWRKSNAASPAAAAASSSPIATLASSCSLVGGDSPASCCLLTGHCQALLCAAAFSAGLLCLLALSRHASDAAGVGPGRGDQRHRLLARLVEASATEATLSARALNGPALRGAFQAEAVTDAARLMQLASRFNYDQNFIRQTRASQQCRLRQDQSHTDCNNLFPSTTGRLGGHQVTYIDQVCNYLPIDGGGLTNLAAMATADRSLDATSAVSIAQLAADAHSLILTVTVLTVCGLLLAGCCHLLGRIVFTVAELRAQSSPQLSPDQHQMSIIAATAPLAPPQPPAMMPAAPTNGTNYRRPRCPQHPSLHQLEAMRCIVEESNKL